MKVAASTAGLGLLGGGSDADAREANGSSSQSDSEAAIDTQSQAAQDSDVMVVRLRVGAFRPSHAAISYPQILMVRWVNEDDVEFLLASTAGA